MPSAAATSEIDPNAASLHGDPGGDLWDNPHGTDGFEFVEYTSTQPQALASLFERLGFTAVARHRRKRVTLYRQGQINFILNAEPRSQAERFARQHGQG
ncbi:MAG: hypothetical protein ACR2RL_04315, partial [Gammaproteobacteria bacterium]